MSVTRNATYQTWNPPPLSPLPTPYQPLKALPLSMRGPPLQRSTPHQCVTVTLRPEPPFSRFLL
ncbi:hypothetical protein ERO13_A05G359901v2 [Gossypium hirsutum]|uniref:Uncharacterized protein n=1 Tax=Gossypium tomentosum TaxID=34277 RepID=A0A5D2QQR8_GOSTO|nr:hypothetical protein ERO13_A05G359901v2 [Gossypium hirsutum]TYI30699.1 hypothetical protein ES332_A05G405400v1 [Gossypium tomentosum]